MSENQADGIHTQPESSDTVGAQAVLVALVAYDKWCRNANTITAQTLREALHALDLHGSLAACWAGIILRAEAAIAKAEGR
jgi:hypothetical protein